MKKIFTLLIGLFFVANSFSQKYDYDNSTDWFWGVNMGAAWNTTDVENRTNVGWSFLLGKEFNANYGRIVSFDLRMRYLRSNWRGLDGDTTSLLNYTPQYMAPEYQTYQANPGYVVNNFKTRVHELGLELVLHANRFRERTGWDPYIFGGANITWSQTFGDLINLDSTLFFNGQYDYSGDLTKSDIKTQLDGDYETALNANSLSDNWNVDFMPSLGIGMGYQVGPRVSIGLEWKTTFALRDDWDGFENPEKQWGLFKNDVYHYTNGYVRIQIGKHNENVNIQQPNNTQVIDNTPIQAVCNDPEIDFINPSRNNITVEAQLYVLNARLRYISGRQQIHVYVNNVETTNYYFNSNTGDLDGNINLVEGQNTIKITATNACGTDVETTVIVYETCKNPVINFTAPSHTNFNVDEDNYIVRANILNGATSVTYSFNGINSQNFNYNSNTGNFESNVVLVRGNNTVIITATNDCGTVSQTIVLNHTNCADPFVQFNTSSNTVVTENNYTISAAVMNVLSKNDIGFRVNGMNKTFSFNLSTSVLQALVNLNEGQNPIEIFASNACGSESEIITIIYEPCKNPIINFIVPFSQISETAVGSQSIQANIANINGVNNIQLIVNGILTTGGTYTSTTGVFQHNVRLQEGVNTVAITATNDCGTVTQTVTITFNACTAPIIGLINPNAINSSQTETSLSVSASVVGVGSVNQIQLVHNGNILNGGTYNGATKLYQKTVTLSPGSNTFLIIATNECGTEQQEFTVKLEKTVEEEFIQICLKGREGNETLEIPLAQWPTYQQQGAVLGPCPDVDDVVVEMITICHKPPGNPENTQELEIPVSAWAAHQAHGDNLGPCPVVEDEDDHDDGDEEDDDDNSETDVDNEEVENENGFGGGGVIISNNGNNEEEEEEKILICHKPPGNPENTQELEIPISAWAAHQAHGDNLGPCPVVEDEDEDEDHDDGEEDGGDDDEDDNSETDVDNEEVENENGFGGGGVIISNNGNNEEEEEEKILICHKPPGNPENTQELEIPISAWAAHQAHGDLLGPCPVVEDEDDHDDGDEEDDDDNSETDVDNEEVENENGFGGGGVIISNNGNNEEEGEDKILICHKPPGNPENTQELEIPISAWAAHQAHGDLLGPCPELEEIEVEEEQQIVICHKTGRRQEEITIPISEWATHQAHGDLLGPCRDLEEEVDENSEEDEGDIEEEEEVDENNEEEEEETEEPTKGTSTKGGIIPKVTPTINGGTKPKGSTKPRIGKGGIGGGR